jgi:hypothetical protein
MMVSLAWPRVGLRGWSMWGRHDGQRVMKAEHAWVGGVHVGMESEGHVWSVGVTFVRPVH